jgi:hypothetical protein
MRAWDDPASRAEPERIRTEREFMDALRGLRVMSGLSYRDVALRMSHAAPRHAMAKSTLAALFAQDGLPRRPGQLAAIVDVLTAELAEPADMSARYLEAWTRLMTARSAQPSPTAGPQQASPPVMPPWQPAPLYSRPAYRQAGDRCTTPDEAKSEFEQAGGTWPLLIFGTVLSVITWLVVPGGPVSFWMIWLMWCGPVLVVAAIAELFRHPRSSDSPELPDEYLRYEQHHTTPRSPSAYWPRG